MTPLSRKTALSKVLLCIDTLASQLQDMPPLHPCQGFLAVSWEGLLENA